MATPPKACDSLSRYEDYSELGELSPRSPLEPVYEDGPFGPIPEGKKRTSCELRELWQKAILQQILLFRMEKEKQKLQASENDLLNKCLNLDYEEITPCLKEVTTVWEKILSTPGRSKIKFDMEKMHSAVGQGKPNWESVQLASPLIDDWGEVWNKKNFLGSISVAISLLFIISLPDLFPDVFITISLKLPFLYFTISLKLIKETGRRKRYT